MKKLSKTTFEELIKIKIDFINNNSIFDKKDFELVDKGELKAYNEILNDIDNMNKDNFINKYVNIIRKLEGRFTDVSHSDDKEIEELAGYNNGIVNILSFIDPSYMYQK